MRKAVVSVTLALVLVVLAVWAVAGQAGGAQITLPALNVSQIVSAVATIVQEDGSVITQSVPVSVNVGLTIDLVPQQSGPEVTGTAEPKVFALDDAAGLVATLDDMPFGYFAEEDNPRELSANESLANAFVDPVAMLEELESNGRLGGAYSSYINSQFSLMGGGNGEIATYAIVFDSEDGADAFLEGAIEREWQRTTARRSVAAVSAPRLGENSIAFRSELEEDDSIAAIDYYSRLGNLILIVNARSLPIGGDFDEVVEVMHRLLAKAVRL